MVFQATYVNMREKLEREWHMSYIKVCLEETRGFLSMTEVNEWNSWRVVDGRWSTCFVGGRDSIGDFERSTHLNRCSLNWEYNWKY